MIRVDCACGRTIHVDDAMGGKRGRCPSCKAVLQIPDAAPATYAVNGDPDVPSAWASAVQPATSPVAVAPPPPASAPPAAAAVVAVAPPPAPPRPAPSMPSEPLPYLVIDVCARLIYALGAIVLVVGGIGSMNVAANTRYVEELGMGYRIFTVGAPLLSGFGVFLGAVVLSSAILVALDVARNVREMRWRP